MMMNYLILTGELSGEGRLTIDAIVAAPTQSGSLAEKLWLSFSSCFSFMLVRTSL